MTRRTPLRRSLTLNVIRRSNARGARELATAVTAHFKILLAKLGALGVLAVALNAAVRLALSVPPEGAALRASRLAAYRDRL